MADSGAPAKHTPANRLFYGDDLDVLRRKIAPGERRPVLHRSAVQLEAQLLPSERPRTPRLGYPTQKPDALLERIIRACSNEGDTVLDA